MWIGLLFGIMSLSALSARRKEGLVSLPSMPNEVNKYRKLSASAMALADYTKSKAYTVESLMLYTASEYFQSGMTQVKVWTLLGLVIRSAMHMGYHRDSKHFGNISIFHGEMRRRVWHIIYQIEVFSSFQVGLPSMIRPVHSDTDLPRNLYDHDFSVSCTELPESRPETEVTPILYSTVKCRLMAVFALVAEISHLIAPPQYQEILDLDSRLGDVYVSVPPILRWRPMDESITDTPDIIMNRCNLELLFHKTRCVLHRRYFAIAQNDSSFAYSREACLDAAMKILHCHSIIYNASQPGRQLSQVRWYMATLNAHDFLLAAMIICLELKLESQRPPDVPDNRLPPGPVAQEDMVRALKASHQIWHTSGSDTSEACQAIEVMLGKIERIAEEDGGINGSSVFPAQTCMFNLSIQLPQAH